MVPIIFSTSMILDIFLITFICCAHVQGIGVRVHMSGCVRQLAAVGSLLPRCGSQVLNSGHEAWQKVPLPDLASLGF